MAPPLPSWSHRVSYRVLVRPGMTGRTAMGKSCVTEPKPEDGARGGHAAIIQGPASHDWPDLQVEVVGHRAGTR